jgi:hypothetical protein
MQIKAILILSAIIIGMSGAMVIAWRQLNKARDERDQAVEFNNIRDDSLQYFRNKAGHEVARAQVSELSASNARAMLEDERLAWIRNFESVNKRLNNIEQASRTTAVAMGNFRIPLRDTMILNIDSFLTKVKTFDNHNEWFRIRGMVLEDTVVTTPIIPVPLQSVLTWQRKRKLLGIRFGRKQWFSETASENPYVKITKHEVIRVGKKK